MARIMPRLAGACWRSAKHHLNYPGGSPANRASLGGGTSACVAFPQSSTAQIAKMDSSTVSWCNSTFGPANNSITVQPW